VSSLVSDLRFAIRGFTRTPGVTLLALLTLAVGVGANAAIFSVIHSVMIEPLPYPHGDRVVIPWRTSASMGNLSVSPAPADLEKWLAMPVFDGVTRYSRVSLVMTGGDEPESLSVARVDTRFLDFTGMQPVYGRPFTTDDAASEAAARVVLLTDGVWKRRFGGDRGVIGRRVVLSDNSYEVIGILPPVFKMPLSSVDLLAPLPPPPAGKPARAFSTVSALARLAPGVSLEAAQDQLTAAGVEAIGGAKDWRVRLMRPTESTGESFRRALLVLFAAVGFVLLIACANVANLVLARNASREREIAVRAALGAGRGRLARQLLTENLLLALLGGSLGILIGIWGVNAIASLRPPEMRALEGIRLNWQMLAFGFAVAAATGIAFGLYPAMAAARRDAVDALRQGMRSAGDARGRRVRRVLTVAEVALALILLAGSGLLIRSYERLQRADLGFNPERLLALNVSLPDARYATPASKADFYRQLSASIGQLPGVSYSGLASGLPPRGGMIFGQVEIEGKPLGDGQKPSAFGGGWVSPGYFEAMRIPVLEGRGFVEEDTRKDANVLVINDAMARRYWPGESAVGRRVRSGPKAPWSTIVGVVGSVKSSHDDADGLQTYYPVDHANLFPDTSVLVATVGDPAHMIAAVKGQAWALDPKLPLKEIATIEARVAETLARPRFNVVLLSIFAGVGLLLAVIGIYGVISYSVGVRQREIGVRMALGALPADIRRAVLGEALLLTGIGTAIGLAGALGLGRYLRSLVYEVSTSDPLTLGAVALILVTAGVVAAWLPARRAMLADPMEALRAE
jgi:putative ABC transport system permease protein